MRTSARVPLVGRAAELELLKEFNESIVESINVGLLAVDLDGRITRLNSALEEIFSLARDEAIGKGAHRRQGAYHSEAGTARRSAGGSRARHDSGPQ